MSRARSRRLVPVALALLVVAAAAVVALWWPGGGADAPSAASTSATATGAADPGGGDPGGGGSGNGSGVAGSGPTADPTAPTPVTATSTGTPSATPVGPASVGVAVTWSGWDDATASVLAGGVVGDVVESGGTCTLTLALDGVVVAGESAAEPDATSTSCGQVAVPGSDLAAGTWEAVLGYSSERSAGQSAPFTVVVP